MEHPAGFAGSQVVGNLVSQLRHEELSEFGFFTAETLPFDMTKTLRNRVLAALRRISSGKGVYLENQE